MNQQMYTDLSVLHISQSQPLPPQSLRSLVTSFLQLRMALGHKRQLANDGHSFFAFLFSVFSSGAVLVLGLPPFPSATECILFLLDSSVEAPSLNVFGNKIIVISWT